MERDSHYAFIASAIWTDSKFFRNTLPTNIGACPERPARILKNFFFKLRSFTMIDSRDYASQQNSDKPEQVNDGAAHSRFGVSDLLQQGRELNLFNKQCSSDQTLQSLGFPAGPTIFEGGKDLVAAKPGVPLTDDQLKRLEDDKRIYSVGGQRGTMESGTFKPSN